MDGHRKAFKWNIREIGKGYLYPMVARQTDFADDFYKHRAL
jgi:hypothetical protein